VQRTWVSHGANISALQFRGAWPGRYRSTPLSTAMMKPDNEVRKLRRLFGKLELREPFCSAHPGKNSIDRVESSFCSALFIRPATQLSESDDQCRDGKL